MAINCLHEPPAVAFVRTFESAVAIMGAVAAWLGNNSLRSMVWRVGESRRKYELLKGLRAEIKSFSGKSAEDYWASPAAAEPLIANLEANIEQAKPLAPYLVVYEESFVFDELKTNLISLPSTLIEATIQYYYCALALNKQLLDFRSEFFAGINRQRQIEVIKDAFNIGKEASQAREQALALIESRLARYERLRSAYRHGGAVIALGALFIGLPIALVQAQRVYSATIISAVVWASACDLFPKDQKSSVQPDAGRKT